MSHYIGVLEGDADCWGVWFPDIMGCVGAGATEEAAIQDATSALGTIASMMLADGEALPKARKHSELLQDPWVAEAVGKGDVLISIPLLVENGRSARANISLDTGLLQAIDAAAKVRGLTRSSFIASTMRDKIMAEI